MADNKEETLSLKQFYDMLAGLEGRIEKKMDEMKRGVITWKALLIVILPTFALAGWTVLAHHEKRPHEGAATVEEMEVLRDDAVVDRNEYRRQLEKFNDNLSKNSQAIERLSTAIEYAFPAPNGREDER